MAGASRPWSVMSKGLRWAWIAFALIVVLVATLLLFARQLVEFAASTATGREVQISGAFDIDYSLTPRIHASKITVSNPDWSERPNMLSAASITAQVDLRALLHGKVVLPEVHLESPVLYLEKATQGPANWQLGSSGSGQESGVHRQLHLPSIEHLSINDGRISYFHSGKNLKVTATVDTLEATAALGKPMSLSASGMFSGVAYKLVVSGAPISSLADAAGGAYPFSLDISTAPADVHASGKLGAPLAENESDIRWTIRGSELARLLPGDGARSLPQDYEMKGRLQGRGGNWTLSGFHASLGQSRLNGSVALNTTGDKPFLRASLHAPVTDLAVIEKLAEAWTSQGDQAAISPSLAPVWKRLHSVNAIVHLSVDQIAGSDLPLQNLELDASLLDGMLKVAPLRVALGNGKLSASLEMNAAAPSRNGKIAMQFDQLPLAPVLGLLPYTINLDGVLDGRVALGFAAGKIGVAEGHLHYGAAAGKTSLNLVLRRVQAKGSGWLVHLDVDGRLRNAPVKVRFAGQPIALLADSEMTPVSLDVAVANSRLQLQGSAADAGATFDLKLSASGPGTSRLSRITGVDLPKLPEYRIEAHLARKRGLIRVDGLQARLGQSSLSGSIALDDLRSPEMLRLDLRARTLAYADFDQLMSGEGQLPDLTAWMRRLDAEVKFVAERIIGPHKAVFRRVRLDATLHDGRLHIAPMRFAVGGGKVSASATLDYTASGPTQGSLQARVEHVRLAEALRPFGLGRRFPGLLDANIDFMTGSKRQEKGISTMRYRDPAAGTDVRMRVTATAGQLQVRGRGRMQHEQFLVDGTAAAASELAGGGFYPFKLDFKAFETSGHIAGTVEQPFRLNHLKATLAIAGPNPRRVEPVTGFRMPELPPYSLTGTLTSRDGVWRFSNIEGEAGNSDLSGWIRLDNSDGKPHVRARLHSQLLDFDDLGGVIGAAPGDGPGDVISPLQRDKARQLRQRSTVLPDEDFEFPSFTGFNADVRYSAAKVDAERLPLDSLQMTFQVKDGRLHLSPLLAGVGGGTVRMDLHLVDKPGERPVRGRIELDIAGVSMARILDPFDIAEGSAGLVSGHGQFDISGESVARMMASMTGAASLAMRDGRLNAAMVELAGLDAGEALLLGLGTQQTVEVNCGYIGASVRSGWMEIDTGVVDTTDTRLTMNGAVDLGTEGIDLQFRAHPKDPSLFAVRAPLVLEGTFKDPDFHPYWGSLLARGAAALVLGAITPPAALLAFVEPGMGEEGAPCDAGRAHGAHSQ